MNKYLTMSIEYSINMVQRIGIEREFISFLLFLDSSMVEHTAVNRGVVGSSPTRGVKLERVRNRIWLLGQAVKTSPFHGGNTGSIPVGVT